MVNLSLDPAELATVAARTRRVSGGTNNGIKVHDGQLHSFSFRDLHVIPVTPRVAVPAPVRQCRIKSQNRVQCLGRRSIEAKVPARARPLAVSK